MLLQVALDVLDLAHALRLAESVGDVVDRVEVGTPLLRSYGVGSVQEIRAVLPNSVVVADCKTMDCGALDAEAVIAKGADGLIVQAAAPARTIEAASWAASELGGFVMVDDLGVDNIAILRRRIKGLAIEHVILHTGKDEQLAGASPHHRLREAAATDGLPSLAVAGGLDADNLPDVVGQSKVDIVIVGAAICMSDRPRETAANIQRVLRQLDTTT